MKHLTQVLTVAALLAASSLSLGADNPPSPPEESFATGVVPLLKAHCVRCHGGNEPKGDVSLEGLTSAWDVQKDYELGQRMFTALTDGFMPPEGSPKPGEDEIKRATSALEKELAKYDCQGDKHPGRVTLRRLNRAEYNNTVRDLVGIDFRPADDFPNDDVGHGFDNIGDVLSIPPVLLEKYLGAAEQIVERAFSDDQVKKRVLGVDSIDLKVFEGDAARQSLSAFARRAFRRPPADDETTRLMQIVDLARKSGASAEDAYRTALTAVLASPHFLFRVELDPAVDDPDGIRELNDHELATRLSYFLWSTMPDQGLFDLADAGQLRSPEVLAQQVTRMLNDPKANALVQNFAGQWLQLRDLRNMTPDPGKYPNFDESLRSAMRRETEMFFEAVIREDRSILDFLQADFSFMNERLARHYGVSGVQGDEFRRVQLDDRRRGVVTHASILLLTSNPTRTSPVKRGKWILENILGDPPPPPPPGVDELAEEGELLGSLRERMEQHRANEACAVCHRPMDPLGFGLENFDGIGGWRDRDGADEIDPSGILPGGLEFRGPKELMAVLAGQKRDQFCRCFTQKMLVYALGRGLNADDKCAVDEILDRLNQGGHRFGTLVHAIVSSDPFLQRERKREE